MNKTTPTNIALLSCFAFFFTTFTLGHFIYPNLFAISNSYNLHRSELLAFLAATLFFLVTCYSYRQYVHNKFFEVANRRLLGVTALLALACSLMHESIFGIYQISTYAALLVGAICLSLIPRQNLAAIAVSAFLLFSVLSTLQLSAYSLNGVPPAKIDVIYGFSHVRFLNHFQTIMIPVSIGYALHHRNNSPLRWLLLLGVSTAITQLLLTGGRGTSLALIVSTGFGLLMFRRHALSYLFALLACVVIGVITMKLLELGWQSDSLNGFATTRLPDITRTTSPGRILLWQNALEIIATSPLLGIGPGVYRFELSPGYVVTHPHNELLALAVEYGVVVAVLAAISITVILYKLSKQLFKESGSGSIELGAWTGIVAAFIHSMVSGIFMTASGQLAFMTALAICISRTSPVYTVRTIAKVEFSAISIQLIVAAMFLIVASQFTSGTFDMLSPNCESDTRPSPRVWLHSDSPCSPKLK